MDESELQKILRERFEDVDLEEKIGGGMIFDVYSGKYRGLKCVIKVTKENVLDNHPAIIDRIREIYTMISKEGVPHFVIQNFALGEIRYYDGTPAFVLIQEKADGNLMDYSKDRSLDELLEWSITLCDALVYLHSLNIVHNDLHPRNVLVSNYGVKISDFGLSYFTSGRFFPSISIGKSPFHNPEFSGRKRDIYSLGSILFYLFSGKVPERKLIGDRRYVLKELSRRIKLEDKEDLVRIILRCWNSGKEGFHDVREARVELQRFYNKYIERFGKRGKQQFYIFLRRQFRAIKKLGLILLPLIVGISFWLLGGNEKNVSVNDKQVRQRIERNYKQEIERLQFEKAELKREVSDIRKLLKAVQEGKGILERENSKLRTSLNNASKRIKNLEEEIRKTSSELMKVTQEKNETERKLSQLERDLRRVSEEYLTVKEALTNTRNSLNDSSTLLSKLKAKLSKNEEIIRYLTKERDALSSELYRLRKTHDELSEKFDAVEDDRNRLKELLEATKLKLDEKTKQLSSLKAVQECLKNVSLSDLIKPVPIEFEGLYKPYSKQVFIKTRLVGDAFGIFADVGYKTDEVLKDARQLRLGLGYYKYSKTFHANIGFRWGPISTNKFVAPNFVAKDISGGLLGLKFEIGNLGYNLDVYAHNTFFDDEDNRFSCNQKTGGFRFKGRVYKQLMSIIEGEYNSYDAELDDPILWLETKSKWRDLKLYGGFELKVSEKFFIEAGSGANLRLFSDGHISKNFYQFKLGWDVSKKVRLDFILGYDNGWVKWDKFSDGLFGGIGVKINF